MDEKSGRFEAQVLPHLDAAYRFACYLSSTPSDADDILQEAIFRAFRGFDTLRGTHVKAWLLAIVRNCHLTALSQWQKHAFVPLPEEDDAQDGHAMISTTPDPEGDSIRRDEGRTLDRLLAALPEEHREVLVLREIEVWKSTGRDGFVPGSLDWPPSALCSIEYQVGYGARRKT